MVYSVGNEVCREEVELHEPEGECHANHRDELTGRLLDPDLFSPRQV